MYSSLGPPCRQYSASVLLCIFFLYCFGQCRAKKDSDAKNFQRSVVRFIVVDSVAATDLHRGRSVVRTQYCICRPYSAESRLPHTRRINNLAADIMDRTAAEPAALPGLLEICSPSLSSLLCRLYPGGPSAPASRL